MIGNDVIDLALAKIESNWQRSRFLAKIFTKKEQEIIISYKYKSIPKSIGVFPYFWECFFQKLQSFTSPVICFSIC